VWLTSGTRRKPEKPAEKVDKHPAEEGQAATTKAEEECSHRQLRFPFNEWPHYTLVGLFAIIHTVQSGWSLSRPKRSLKNFCGAGVP
jgi:hypothetical protein